MAADEHREERAIDWLVRQREPDFDGWEAFTEWLEADPANAEVYGRLAVAEADLDALVPPAPVAVEPPAPRRRTGRYWLGGAVAAGLIGAVTLVDWRGAPSPALTTLATAAGEHRDLRLGGGVGVAMNGSSRLLLDPADPRRAELDSGQVLLTVRHDPAHPFRLTVGGKSIVDVGTVFAVTRADGVLDVAVAEGAVVYDPEGLNLSVPAGQALHLVEGAGPATVAPIDRQAVGDWHEGRLVYAAAPLSAVAADLTRNLGVSVHAAPAVAARPFSGVVSLAGGADAVAGRIGPLLDVRVRRTTAGWELMARP